MNKKLSPSIYIYPRGEIFINESGNTKTNIRLFNLPNSMYQKDLISESIRYVLEDFIDGDNIIQTRKLLYGLGYASVQILKEQLTRYSIVHLFADKSKNNAIKVSCNNIW